MMPLNWLVDFGSFWLTTAGDIKPVIYTFCQRRNIFLIFTSCDNLCLFLLNSKIFQKFSAVKFIAPCLFINKTDLILTRVLNMILESFHILIIILNYISKIQF